MFWRCILNKKDRDVFLKNEYSVIIENISNEQVTLSS